MSQFLTPKDKAPYTLSDVDDWLSDYSYYLHWTGRGVYLGRNIYVGDKRTVRHLHEDVMIAAVGRLVPGCHIDHPYGNHMDNSREHLRVLTPHLNSLNHHNRKPAHGFFGAAPVCRGFKASISVKGWPIHLGHYPTAFDAGMVRDVALWMTFPELRGLNVITFNNDIESIECPSDAWVMFGRPVPDLRALFAYQAHRLMKARARFGAGPLGSWIPPITTLDGKRDGLGLFTFSPLVAQPVSSPPDDRHSGAAFLAQSL